MSRIESSSLGAELMGLLDGSDLDGKVGETMLLLTTSESGWPHLAMLSVGEVLAASPDELRLALWKGTESGANLGRTGKATLVIIHGGAGHYVELDGEPAGDLVSGDGPLALFTARVHRILSDEVGYATITSGIRFDLPDREKVVARWGRTVAAMRAG